VHGGMGCSEGLTHEHGNESSCELASAHGGFLSELLHVGLKSSCELAPTLPLGTSSHMEDGRGSERLVIGCSSRMGHEVALASSCP
jgi:hypothetical protein